ncbi:recombination protein RecR, partial [Candidatus Margulisiibacteriota bacterium]
MYAETLKRLISELQRMPGIGPKSAQRLAFYILQSSQKDVESLLLAIQEAKGKLTHCSVCFNITDVDPCHICANSS